MKITKPTLTTIYGQAIDIYPKEAVGLLLGCSFVEQSFVFQNPQARTTHRAQIGDCHEIKADEWFKTDYILGEWHSHPNDVPTASETDKSEILNCNTPYLGEGSYMFIVSIRPSRRKPYWVLHHKCYIVKNGRVVREKVEIV